MPLLNANSDHVATVRKACRTDAADTSRVAVQYELAGASRVIIVLRNLTRELASDA
jgi:pyridoxine 5'-phosphate synthase PdxJ